MSTKQVENLDAKDQAEVRAAFDGWLKGKTRRRERLAELGLFNRRSVFGVIEYAPTVAALPYAPRSATPATGIDTTTVPVPGIPTVGGQTGGSRHLEPAGSAETGAIWDGPEDGDLWHEGDD